MDKEQWNEAVISRARELNFLAIPNTYNSLRDEAEKGSYQHQKLLLELTGEYTPRQELTGASGGPIVINWDDDNNN